MTNQLKSLTKTVLITGCSSGIGKATAQLLATKGFNVIATMRKPELETELNQLDNVIVLPLDVTNLNSIQNAITLGIERFGRIDVIVNNAGFAVGGPFETATSEQITGQFETNVGGVMNCTRAILPHFRANQSGIIINISSMGGRVSFPYYSLYNSTKWAVDGFSESLQYELRQFGIKVKIVEPGAIKTDFYSRSQTSSIDNSLSDETTNAYKTTFAKVKAQFDEVGSGGANVKIVANCIHRAITDGSNQLRYTCGMDAKVSLFLKWLLPNQLFFGILHAITNTMTNRVSK